MSGNFINTEHTKIADSIINGMNSLLKNPYCSFQNDKATPVNYYNINVDVSTLDEGSKLAYDDVGAFSPIKYNIIKDFFLYGLDKIETQLQIGENGLESSDITGDAMILPNTIHPYPGDYFTIKYLHQPYLFKVIECTTDTLENGGNYWKISYQLSKNNDKNILNLIENKYIFIPSNVGGKFNPILKEEKYNFSLMLDNASIAAKDYYINLFTDNRIQSYSFLYRNECNIYDPYLLQFLINNNILRGSSSYAHISQLLPFKHDFFIKYNTSIFKAFEDNDIELLQYSPSRVIAEYIDPNIYISSIFSHRWEKYFCINNVNQNDNKYIKYEPIIILDERIIQHILEHKYFEDKQEEYLNIFIYYFYNEQKLSKACIESFLKINYYTCDNSLFYILPLLIFCIDKFIKNTLK